jgi:hypothetical protein
MEILCCWFFKYPKSKRPVPLKVIQKSIPEAEPGPDGSIHIPTEWDVEVRRLRTKRVFLVEPYKQ